MKIKNSYFETLLTKDIASILKKEFSAKTSFHLARIFSKIEIESKTYFSEKQKLVNKHSKKDEAGKTIQANGMVTIEDPKSFSKELEEILEIEIDLGIEKINFDFDKEPSLPVDGMMILLPFIKENKNG